MKIKNYLSLVILVNASAYGMYGRVTELQYAEECNRKIQAQRFARLEQCMEVVEKYCEAKTKELEARKQKESIDTKSLPKVIYKHQDYQAKL